MRSLLHTTILIAGAVFGACVGAVLGLALCLILRDGLQWNMPLSRIGLIAGACAALGGVTSLALDLRRLLAK